MSVDNSKFITSKSIAYNDLTLWDCIKSYPNIFSTYKGNRLQGGSLLCYVFMSAFMFLREKWWTLSSCRTFIISIGLDEKSPVRYWCISVTYQKYLHHSGKRYAGFVCQWFWSLWIRAASEIKQKLQPFNSCNSALLYQHHRAAGILKEGCQVVNSTMSHSTCSGVSSRGVSYYGNDLVNLSCHKCILSWSPSLQPWWCHLYRPPLQGWPCSHSHISGWHHFFLPGCLSILEWKLVWERKIRTKHILPHQCCSHLCREGLLILKPHIPSEKGLKDWRIITSKWHHLPWWGCLVTVKCERKKN